MTKFMFIYHSPPAPADAPEWTPEQMQEEMGKWMAWAGRVGQGMLDFGAPLAGGTRVTSDGTSSSDRQVTGYSLIEADDMEAALALAEGHPHLAMPGAEIEVHEGQPVPGS